MTAYRYDNTATGGGRLIGKYFYDLLDTYTSDSSSPDGMLTLAAESITYTYDIVGRAKTATFYRGLGTENTDVTTTTYDADGRVIAIDSPEGTIRYEYDKFSRLTRTYTGSLDVNPTIGAGEEVSDTRYTYDALGRLKTVTVRERRDPSFANEASTVYTYDKVGNLDEMVAPTKGIPLGHHDGPSGGQARH